MGQGVGSGRWMPQRGDGGAYGARNLGNTFVHRLLLMPRVGAWWELAAGRPGAAGRWVGALGGLAAGGISRRSFSFLSSLPSPPPSPLRRRCRRSAAEEIFLGVGSLEVGVGCREQGVGWRWVALGRIGQALGRGVGRRTGPVLGRWVAPGGTWGRWVPWRRRGQMGRPGWSSRGFPT